MASPQVENGYTQIANELLEQMAILRISPNQWQILLCIIRKTYGFRKKVDYIANRQIVDATGLSKSVVSRGLKLLEEENIIIRDGRYIGVQKDYEQWGKVSRTVNSSCLNCQPELAELSTGVSRTVNSSCLNCQQKLAELSTNSSLLDNKKLAIRKPELAELSTKVSSPVVTQKKKLIQKKDCSSSRDSLKKQVQIISEQLRPEYPDIDFNHEIEKFNAYWFDGKRKLKNPRLALLNWLHRARKYQEGENEKHKNRAPVPGNEPAGAFHGINIWK